VRYLAISFLVSARRFRWPTKRLNHPGITAVKRELTKAMMAMTIDAISTMASDFAM